ncbi:hypothetical protein N7509_010095 [Penicillium cosmopolitanum]|uniref:Uncharacterized protein n=1 Tax=Penicillium cosmopolitanum TaxID=1131564 RepID=A0A9W9VQZ3_9EURO|nr:uncharacterized protein N7509_010095 [Penicillium cosmopolitanum]KAJ5387554.1 hypothetical protein N7509_010095 [Penicillium cosmopolitanum]
MTVEWRERGFVPDSDDEEEFDSLNTNNENIGDQSDALGGDVDLIYIAIPPSPSNPEAEAEDISKQQYQEHEHDGSTTSLGDDQAQLDAEEDGKGSQELASSPAIRLPSAVTPLQQTGTFSNESSRPATPLAKRTPGPRRSARTTRSNSSVTIANQNDDIWDIPSSPMQKARSSRKPRSQALTPKDTPSAKARRNRDTPQTSTPSASIRHIDTPSRDSSPDELMVLVPSPRKPLANINSNRPHRPSEHARSDDESSLSSAKSNISAPSPDNSQIRRDDTRESHEEDTLAQILPGLEIPEEFQLPSSQPELPQEDTAQRGVQDGIQIQFPDLQQESAQQSTRSLRPHKPNQLRPYTSEYAHYHKQMKLAGLRSIKLRAEAPQPRLAEVTDESQGQDSFNPNAIRSSPPAEEYLPAPKPKRRNEEQTTTPRARNHEDNSLTIRRKQSTKRRKRSHSGAWHDGTHLVSNDPRPQMIINSTPPGGLDPSIFDIPTSPPQSGSLSSASRTPRASDIFRFPPGSPPPSTKTLDVDSMDVTPDDDEPTLVNQEKPATSSDEEESSDSSGLESETAEERQIRRLSRQTRGVLPASWHRIDAQKRDQNQKALQASRHAQRADGKGVAKKLLRKSGQPVRPTQMDLGDDDESDEEPQSTRTPRPDEENADEDLARIIGFETPFDEAEEDDNFEDNRVDYMVPPTSRNTDPRAKPNSLKRVHPKESSIAKERRLKRARSQKQTRITDSSYGTQRTKRPPTKSKPKSKSKSKPAPRLGILDAPGVANHPEKDQPRFLRVAARRARSHQDGGRQSPNRKFLQLDSRRDTADANESLWAWRRGAIPQTNIQPRPKPRKNPTPANFSISRQRNTASSGSSWLTNHFPVVETGDSLDIDNDSTHQLPGGANSLPVEAPNSDATQSRSTHAEKRGHQWMIQRNTEISSLRRNILRPAAGNQTERSPGQPISRAMFHERVVQLNRDYRSRNSTRKFKPSSTLPSLPLDRYISNVGPAESSPRVVPQHNPALATESRSKPQVSVTQSRRRLKKRSPKHVDLTLDQFLQDAQQMPPIFDELEVFASTGSEPTRASTLNVGNGLFNWQRSYPLDFGVLPLRSGTFFHESTFIGSGEFARSMQLLKRDLDQGAGFCSIPFKDTIFRWGPWNDKVSSEMGIVFDSIIADVESLGASNSEATISPPLSSSSLALRALVSYASENLTFADPIDRAGFISRSLALALNLRDRIASALAASNIDDQNIARISCYNMVFVNQIRQVANHRLLSLSLGKEALDLIKPCVKDTIRAILSQTGRAEIKRLLEENEDDQRREMGIREGFPYTEACVIADQLLRSSEVFGRVLEDYEVEPYVEGIIRNQKDIGNLEIAWHSLFMKLPLHEIDKQGIARRELRFKARNDNWVLVTKLLSPVFESYHIHSATRTLSYNAYCRTLFQRCHRLINYWGWRDCKPILDTLYEFFAQRTLYNLKLEGSHGSPSFLDELDQNPSLEIRAGEPTFHTFLKIIASGMRFLSKRYDKKIIRNFAWRLLPNHGRMYPKDDDVSYEDLDALRNHHDLLCTLYWVVPDGCRPRLETIRNLVNPATSHIGTCDINLKSWTRLVRFKLSTDEEVSSLEPFAEWHSYLVNELRKQHLLARSEGEAQHKKGGCTTEQNIRTIISDNQIPIESLLSMALDGLLTAVKRAPTLEHAHRLISKTPFESLLPLFDPKVSRVNVVVSEALAVITAYTQKDGPALSSATDFPAPAALPAPEDDSQEYGDWDDIDAVMVEPTILSEGIEHVQSDLHPVVSRLVSDCFGADDCPDDAILESTVDCWTSVAQVLVRHGIKRWEDYLDPFGDESWKRLREKAQTRKFSPRFLAACIEKDSRILSDCRVLVMGMWMSSLMERSALLKFQHCLTEVLLNDLPKDPLLRNLPFYKEKKAVRYKLTIEELAQRRISLISSVLSNMREHVLGMELSADRNLSVTKREYSEVLEQMMSAMKKNYLELGGAVADARSDYVNFVHRIIRFLQELTNDIKPVDPFFINPALFPLPSSDPQYVVARLKRYVPKLSSEQGLQALIMFTQGIVERAIMEGQQDHLTDQLHAAMANTYEAGDPDKPTLRAILLQCIFPGYIELVFSARSAWLLSRSIIRSMTLVLKDLLFDMDATDSNCVSSVLGIFDAVFCSAYRALHPLSNRPAVFQNTCNLVMLATFIEMISSTLVVVDFIDRLTGVADETVSYIKWFRDFAVSVLSHLDDANNAGSMSEMNIQTDSGLQRPLGTPPSLPSHLVATRTIAFEEHQSCLKNWSSHGGRYYHTRSGHDSKEATLEPQIEHLVGNNAEARKALSDAVGEFLNRIDQLEFFADEHE